MRCELINYVPPDTDHFFQRISFQSPYSDKYFRLIVS